MPMTLRPQTTRLQANWLLLGLLALTPLTLRPLLQDPSPQEPGQHRQEDGDDDHEEGPLHDIMKNLKHEMRSLRHSLGSEDTKAAALEHAEAIKGLTLKALPHCPPAPEGFSEAEQLKWRVDFERKMLAVADTMLQLELSMADGDLQAAQDLYRTAGGIKKEGHDTYDPEDEDE